MTTSLPRMGIVLFAHGSRDPLWRLPVEAIAARIRTDYPGAPVACAYLELCEPDLPTALNALVAAGAQRIRVLPVFFGMGKHAREDLPELVAHWTAANPQTSIDLLPPAGEHPALTALLAQLAVAEPVWPALAGKATAAVHP
jgi:sirohydrochlorin cobaltochelatase